jgi:hypothetical protein
MGTVTVLVREFVARYPLLRSSVRNLFDYLDGYDTIVLNFDGVGSISRAFAEEVVAQGDGRDVKVDRRNCADTVEEVFEAVGSAVTAPFKDRTVEMITV